MRMRFFWPLAVILLGLLSGPSCEDDPGDLLYLKNAGTSGGGTTAGAAAGATAGVAGH